MCAAQRSGSRKVASGPNNGWLVSEHSLHRHTGTRLTKLSGRTNSVAYYHIQNS